MPISPLPWPGLDWPQACAPHCPWGFNQSTSWLYMADPWPALNIWRDTHTHTHTYTHTASFVLSCHRYYYYGGRSSGSCAYQLTHTHTHSLTHTSRSSTMVLACARLAVSETHLPLTHTRWSFFPVAGEHLLHRPLFLLPHPFSRRRCSSCRLSVCWNLAFYFISYPPSSIVGRPRHQGVMVGMGQKDSYVGYATQCPSFIHSALTWSLQRRGTVKTWHPHPQVPHRTRYRHQLGWHGKNLAPHFLQRTSCCSRGTPRPPHRGPPQSKG